jgi:hypothetical protein
MNNDLEGIWKEAVTAYFKVSYLHLPGGPEENSEDSQSVQPMSRSRFDPLTF